MKRILFVLLVVAAAAAGGFMYLKEDTGTLTAGIAGYTLETTLLQAGLVVLGLLLGWMLLSWLWSALHRLASLFGEKREQRLAGKARLALVQGLIEMAEGRYGAAEKLLLQKVEHNEHALIAWLSAARAAQQLEAYDRRDEYLRNALRDSPDAHIAVGLTQAELQLEHEQHEQALATLTHLNELAPRHPGILRQLAIVQRRVGNWNPLLQLLPDIEKTGAMNDEERLSLQLDAWSGLITERARGNDIDALTALWKEVPPELVRNAELIEHYASELSSLGAYGEAEHELREYLDTHWSASVIQAYASLEVLATDEQIHTAESWLQEHHDDPYLLLALGRMHISRSRWEEARRYLEAGIAVQPMPITFLKLAQLLEDHLDETAQATEYYRQGLHMLTGDYGEAVLARVENDFQRVIDTRPELKVIH